jgi:hypothetical protein
MARNGMDLTSFVGKLLKEDDSDILREGIQALDQMIMDVEVSSKIGAAAYERSEDRTACRNGYRTRVWDIQVGSVELGKSSTPTNDTLTKHTRHRCSCGANCVVKRSALPGVHSRQRTRSPSFHQRPPADPVGFDQQASPDKPRTGRNLLSLRHNAGGMVTWW